MAILVIDDEAGLRRALAAHLEDMDYDVLSAENGRQGLDILEHDPGSIQAVVVDLNMPVMDGYSFIQNAVVLAPDLPLVVLSGVGVVEDALRAMRLGAWDFVTKPLSNMAVLDHVLDRVLDRARLVRENRLYQENLERLVKERTAELELTRRQIMQRLSRAAEYKDNETGHHVIRVGEISALLARAMGLSGERCEMMRECAPLHDVGKIGIPDSILRKRGKLDPGEWEEMKRHALYGAQILESATSPIIQCARVIALNHHERFDGTGYPHGLSGQGIPIFGRICAVADVFDALVSKRPYKDAYPEELALSIMRKERGRHFDPAVLDVFLENARAFADIRARLGEGRP